MNGNELVPKNGSSGLIAADYILDSTITTLLDFNVDLDNFTVILYFSETVASDTIDCTKFHTFSDEVGTRNFTLTNGTTDLPYTHVLTLVLAPNDAFLIKLIEKFWTNMSDTWPYVMHVVGK